MALDKYYKHLGLKSGANREEIRKAYRKLAMHYHPDRNSSSTAQHKFLVVTEAYEILTGKRPAPPRTQQSKGTEKRTPKSKNKSNTSDRNHEQRTKEARERYQEQMLREKLEDEQYFQKLTSGAKWKTVRFAAVLGSLISILLILDLFLPHHYKEDRVTEYSLNRAFGANRLPLSLIHTENGDALWIGKMTYKLYHSSPNIYKESSWIFHQPIRVISLGKIQNKVYNVHFTFYSNMFIAIFLFSIPLFTLFYKRRTAFFTMLYHLSYFGVSILLLYFLATNDRWIHLLTLGFL
ncbi:MAG: DnaJ domain-containing protein [Crocinitomicaceae bacterium]|nr:DnaJ domain-containing protein [Crocinitomicaceae bacterium]